MAKKPLISDDLLRTLLKNYFVEECMGDPTLIKMRDASVYIQNHGYPKYQYESLRKNPVAKEYFEEMRKEGLNSDIQILASYATMDVEAFIACNNTKPKLIAALTKLDTYHHDVSMTTLKIKDENDKLQTALVSKNAEIKKIKGEVDKQKEKYAKAREELKAVKEALSVANKYIDSVVYDGYARQLLEERNILVQDVEVTSDIPKEKIKDSIIRSDMDIIEVLKAGFEEEAMQ